jgi:hypothetical protein
MFRKIKMRRRIFPVQILKSCGRLYKPNINVAKTLQLLTVMLYTYPMYPLKHYHEAGARNGTMTVQVLPIFEKKLYVFEPMNENLLFEKLRASILGMCPVLFLRVFDSM